MFQCKSLAIPSWRMGAVEVLELYTEKSSSKAMLLNALIAAVFVLVGSFRGLLSFKGKQISRVRWHQMDSSFHLPQGIRHDRVYYLFCDRLRALETSLEPST